MSAERGLALAAAVAMLGMFAIIPALFQPDEPAPIAAIELDPDDVLRPKTHRIEIREARGASERRRAGTGLGDGRQPRTVAAEGAQSRSRGGGDAPGVATGGGALVAHDRGVTPSPDGAPAGSAEPPAGDVPAPDDPPPPPPPPPPPEEPPPVAVAPPPADVEVEIDDDDDDDAGDDAETGLEPAGVGDDDDSTGG